MSTLRRVSIVMGCALATVVVLEALQWLRPAALSVARATAATARMDDDGVVTLETVDWVDRGPDRGRDPVRNLYDKTGRYLQTVPFNVPNAANLAPATRDSDNRSSNPWLRADQTESRCVENDGPDILLRSLRMADGSGYTYSPRRGSNVISWGGTVWTMPFAWNYEDGRFVCRDPQTNEVVAGVGPDGYATGPAAAAGEKFAAGVTSPIGRWGWYSPDGGRLGVLLDSAGRRVHFLRVADKPKLTAEPETLDSGLRVTSKRPVPLRVEVSTVRVEGPSGEAPVAASDERYAWLWRLGASAKDALVVPLRAGRDLVLASAAGIVYRVPLGDEERDVIAMGDARCVTTVLPPVGGPVARLRVRRIFEDGKVLSDDVDTLPVTTGGRVAAASVGVLSWFRPPVLNAASFAGPRVEDYRDYFARWFTDGVIAGGDGAGWLAGSLAVGALCAWLVRRQALLRAPHRATLWTALGAALGPLALVWTAIALPKSHVASCACGRRRAVHLAKCPACSSDWPAPSATGIEVFA